jgi:fumarate reductase subunit D
MSPRKRSNAPIFWLLFGAGGMLSALLGTMLVFITGIAAPLGAPLGMDYAHALAFARHPIGKAFVFALVMFFAFHAAHRLLCSLHDVGIHKGLLAKSVCYGFALLLSVVSGCALIGVGF